MIVIGLVVEGAHDYLMLEPLLRHEFSRRGYNHVSFKYLQPVTDATGGGFASGGWTRVKAWCERHAGSDIDTFFEPLFSTDPPCDAIIIQMDGDTLEHAEIAAPPPPVSVADRVNAIAAVIQAWLALKPERLQSVAYAIPVLQTEAWILAAERTRHEHANAKIEFRKSHQRTAEKLAAFYLRRVQKASEGFSTICDFCDSYSFFQGSVDQLRLP